MTVLSIAPDSLNEFTKKLDSSKVIPIAANTTANFSFVPLTLACFAICAASCACGSPDAENIGSFCPLTSVLSPSIADIPVCMNSAGYTLAAGFIGSPLMSRLSSGRISGSPSIGLPMPSKTLPSISSETPSSMLRPRNLTLLESRLMPAEFSNSWTIAFVPSTSSTLHLLFSPFDSSISPSSLYVTPSTPRTIIRGPATSCIVLYSLGITDPPSQTRL